MELSEALALEELARDDMAMMKSFWEEGCLLKITDRCLSNLGIRYHRYTHDEVDDDWSIIIMSIMQMILTGLWTYGGVRGFSSSRACTRSCQQMGGGKCSQANNYAGICDDYCNVLRILVIMTVMANHWYYDGMDETTSWQHGSKMMTTIFRFNSVTLETERPSILGPGFTAPPGGPEYLNRNVIYCCNVIWSSARNVPDVMYFYFILLNLKSA